MLKCQKTNQITLTRQKVKKMLGIGKSCQGSPMFIPLDDYGVWVISIFSMYLNTY